jgi:sugar (pentulose or hexulose) kinase
LTPAVLSSAALMGGLGFPGLELLMSELHEAVLLAIDVTTTEMALAVRAADGTEDYAATKMRGGGCWRERKEFPCFELTHVPEMIRDLLRALEAKGWRFQGAAVSGAKYVSVSCRQHDQVVLDKEGTPLLPALSWQCNAAEQDVEELKKLGVEDTVGPIEPRFVLPKLRCVLREEPSLRENVHTVFMTGDWIAFALTGKKSLSKSDALSNGLLDQEGRQLAVDVLRTAGFEVDWFPAALESGKVVGEVEPPAGGESGAWREVRELLQGWQFVAGLGDNHASAVGCGMRDDHRTLVVSAGTSGTVNLSCPAKAPLRPGGKALRFEFYDESLLLLLMLGDCGAWYNRFLEHFAAGYRHCLDDLNMLALKADAAGVQRVLHNDADHYETFPPRWAGASLGEQVAWTQFSIALELLLLTKRMLEATREAKLPDPDTFVLTGGLSQSPWFQHVFHAGVGLIAPGQAVKVSGRTGPLRYKTSAYGALVNAELPVHGRKLSALHASSSRFPLIDCAPPDPACRAALRYFLQSYGL